MIDSLIHSLQALASPAETQLARFPDFVVRADELALDFSDALMLVSNRRKVRLTAAQRGALELLDTYLGEMSGPARPQLWTDDAVRDSPEWETIRCLAREALDALHAPHQPPPPSTATYIPGASPEASLPISPPSSSAPVATDTDPYAE